MRSSWLTLAMNSRRDFSAASIRVTSCSTAMAPPEGRGAAFTSKMRPGASELARPVRTSPFSRAPRTQASRSGSRAEWTSGRPTRIWVPAMRCITALDQRTKPSGVMATTASCMESSIAASSWRRLSISAKLVPSRSAVWFKADSMASNSSSGDGSRRALKSPSEIRRAKSTTRCRRPVTRKATHPARGRATANATRPDQRASLPMEGSAAPALGAKR